MPDISTRSLEHPLATHLLDIGAVLLRPDMPFTWSSGLKAPIYCDNRLTLAHPPVRRRITDGFSALVEAHGLAPELVAGTATAGIPHAAWLAERLDLPMAYVRTGRKTHGRKNQVEGHVTPGQRTVLIEDLISTGGSALTAAQALRAAGAEVSAVLAIFTYGFSTAAARFEAADLPLYTLTDLSTLLDVAVEQERLSPEALATVCAWRADPEGWSSNV